jgi:glycosyltransferase involved in cell wall biosynthesis
VKFGFLGAYDPAYPRNAVIRKGLAALGDEVAEYSAPQSFKVWLRYPTLLARLAAGSPRSGPRVPLSRLDCFFVPEFCQKDVPLGRFLATLLAKPLVFDPLAPRYETKILDWKRWSPSSLHAWWNFRIDAWSFRLSDLILADTGAHKDHFCRAYGVPAGRIGVIPVGYDNELFDPERLPSGPRTGPFTVLFFGSFLPLHGVDSAVEAASDVFGRDPSVVFRFVGSGQTWARTKELAATIGAANCRFEPWVPYHEIPALIAASDVCLGVFGRTAKARRVIPHKLYQSLGMRKPVITARTPAAEEFFTHAENILLCGEPYAETIADAVLALKKDTALGERIAAGGHRLARERFTPIALASALKNMIKTMSSHA